MWKKVLKILKLPKKTRPLDMLSSSFVRDQANMESDIQTAINTPNTTLVTPLTKKQRAEARAKYFKPKPNSNGGGRQSKKRKQRHSKKKKRILGRSKRKSKRRSNRRSKRKV